MKLFYYILLTLIFGTSNSFAQSDEIFSKFIQTDSISAYVDGWEYGCYYGGPPVKDRKLFVTTKERTEIINGIEFTTFSLKTKTDTTAFSIGTKDLSYCFFTNKKRKIGREISQEVKVGSNINIYPFSEEYIISVEKIENIPDFEYVLYLDLKSKRERDGLKLQKIILFSQYGPYFEFTNGKSVFQNEWY